MSRNIADDILGCRTNKQTINSKQKGNRNEITAAKWLKEWTGEGFARTPSSGGLRWGADASFACGDVVCKNQNFNFRFAVETKHLKAVEFKAILSKRSKVYTVFKQAQRDADRAGKLPMVMLRENGMKEGTYWVFFRAPVISFILQAARKLKLLQTLSDIENLQGSYELPDGTAVIVGVHSDFLKQVPYSHFGKHL